MEVRLNFPFLNPGRTLERRGEERRGEERRGQERRGEERRGEERTGEERRGEMVKRFLLYARRSEIRGVDLDDPYLNIITALTVPDIDDVTAMDYDATDERIYWADIKTRAVKRASINGTRLETVMSGDVLSVRGLAVDWLSRNLYWMSSDSEETQINVARLDGSLKTTVVHGIDKPKCLVLHPARGRMYWTDGNTINMANMDGSNNKILHQNQKEPVGLSIDYSSSRLYWISSGNGTINRCNLDGSGLEVIDSLRKDLMKATSLAVMGNELLQFPLHVPLFWVKKARAHGWERNMIFRRCESIMQGPVVRDDISLHPVVLTFLWVT
ncbi:hypothetical protein NFI96_003416 [Prochilodus magdalenae]|nr:hypothetical protein NFI96_003416 [Prochilodus magdalenae]